jgi:hypothetical protein
MIANAKWLTILALTAPALVKATDYYASCGMTDSTCMDVSTAKICDAWQLDLCTVTETENYIISCDTSSGYVVTKTTYSDTACTTNPSTSTLYSNPSKSACTIGNGGLYYKNVCNPLYYLPITHAFAGFLYEQSTTTSSLSSCNTMVSNNAPTATTIHVRDLKTCFSNGDGTSYTMNCDSSFLTQTSYSNSDCSGVEVTMSTTGVASDTCLSTTIFPYLNANANSYMYYTCNPYSTKKNDDDDNSNGVPTWGIALIVIAAIGGVLGLFLIGRYVYGSMSGGGDSGYTRQN